MPRWFLTVENKQTGCGLREYLRSPPAVREHLLGGSIWTKSWRQRGRWQRSQAQSALAGGTVRVEPETRNDLAWQVLGTDHRQSSGVFRAACLKSGGRRLRVSDLCRTLESGGCRLALLFCNTGHSQEVAWSALRPQTISLAMCGGQAGGGESGGRKPSRRPRSSGSPRWGRPGCGRRPRQQTGEEGGGWIGNQVWT